MYTQEWLPAIRSDFVSEMRLSKSQTWQRPAPPVEVEFPETGSKSVALEVACLNLQTPEIRVRVEQFYAEFPAVAALLAFPDDDGFDGLFPGEIDQAHVLVEHEILGNDSKATVVADVQRVTFSAKSLPVSPPLDADGNSGVDAFAGAEPNPFASGREAVVSGHGNPWCSPIGTEQPEVYYFLPAGAKGARAVFARGRKKKDPPFAKSRSAKDGPTDLATRLGCATRLARSLTLRAA
jgi:hypothetical protein